MAEVGQQPPEAFRTARVAVGDRENAVADAGARSRVGERARLRERVPAPRPRRRSQVRIDVEEARAGDMPREIQLTTPARVAELPTAVDELVTQNGRTLRGLGLRRRRMAVHMAEQMAVALRQEPPG